MIGTMLDPDVIAAGLWTVLVWVSGVAFAAYRAVSWVDRMRSWAKSVEVEQ